MHVLQYIAVQADNEDMAMRTVEDTLNHELGVDEYQGSAWFDWFVVGGGRFVDGDPYASSPNHIISYDNDSAKFLEQISWATAARKEEFNNYRKSFNEKNIDLNAKLDSYSGNMQYDFDLYPLSKMIDMLQGQWDYNSYFYDMHTASTNPEHMLDSIDKGNKNWYAVPVDFHF